MMLGPRFTIVAVVAACVGGDLARPDGVAPASAAEALSAPAGSAVLPQTDPGLAKRLAEQREKFADELRLRRFPGWARETAVGLFFAREWPERIDSSQSGVADAQAANDGSERRGVQAHEKDVDKRYVKEEDQLAALDAEIDMLAAALLAMREPDAVLFLLQSWYADETDFFPKDKGMDLGVGLNLSDPKGNWRTPAAPLIFSQAYRLRAWQRFFPRPDKAFEPVTDSRIELFSKANIDLARAANVLIAALGKFGDADVTAPKFDKESLARWASSYDPHENAAATPAGGLPKPRTIWDVRKKDPQGGDQSPPPIDAANARTKQLRESLPAFRAVEFVVTYREWLCRIYRELGDLVYRETAQPASSRGRGTNSQTTSLGWYSLARDHCYAGRLIDYSHRGLREEGRALGDRMDWILHGRAFGGHDLWRLAPLSARNYITPAIESLDVHATALSRLQEKDAERTASQFAATGDLQQRMADRKQLDQFFRAHAQRELTVGILDLKAKLVNFKSDMRREDLERAENDLHSFLLESGVSLSQQQYLGELERLQNQWLHQMLTAAHALQTIGGFEEESETPDAEGELSELPGNLPPPRLSRRMPHIEAPNQASVDTLTQFLESLLPSPTQRELLNTWHMTLRPRKSPEVPRTTIAIRYSEWRAADNERERRDLLWSMHETRIMLREHQKRLDELNELQGKAEQELKGLDPELRGERGDAEAAAAAASQQEILTPKLREEVQHARKHFNRAIDEIRKYQEKLAQVRKAVDDIRKTREKVQESYERFVALIQTAKAIPTTVAAGLATGTMFDAGEAIARGAEAVMEKLNAVLTGQITAAELQSEIDKAEQAVSGFLDKVDQAQKEVREKEAELRKVVDEAKALADYLPGGRVHQQYEERKQHLEEVQRGLQAEIQQTETQIENDPQAKLDAADKRELEILYVQSVNEGRAALGRLVSAYDERDQLLGRLISLKDQWEGVLRERDAAGELAAEFQRGLGERKRTLGQSKEAWVRSKEERDALLPEFQAAILALDAERRELLKPARRLLTTELLEAIAPALALASLNPLPQEQQEALDAANEDLITAARWLYVLTGRERMASLGSPCQSLYELRLARKELEQAWQEFRQEMSAAQPQAVLVSFNRNELSRAPGRMVFRTRLASGGGDAVSVNDYREWLLGKDLSERSAPVWGYRATPAKDGVPEFYLSHASRQGAHGSLIHGVWAICQWKKGNDLRESDANAYPEVRRVGLVRVRTRPGPSGLTALPFYTPGEELPEAGALASFATTREVRRQFALLANGAPDLIAQPLIDPLANRYFGHGLDQTWVFELTDSNGNLVTEKSPAWQELQSVHFVFTFLLPPRAITRDRESGDVRQADFGFLDERPGALRVVNAAEAQSVVAARKAAAEDLRRFQTQPDGRTTVNGKSITNYDAAADALDKLIDELKRQQAARINAQATLGNGLGPPPPDSSVAPEGTNAASRVRSIVQPISLTDQRNEAEALLKLLTRSLEKDYVGPLRKAAEQLERIRGHQDRLRALADKLRVQNAHREMLVEYVTFFENVVATIRGESLSAIGQARLESLLDGAAFDREVENALWTKGAGLLADSQTSKEVMAHLATEWKVRYRELWGTLRPSVDEATPPTP